MADKEKVPIDIIIPGEETDTVMGIPGEPLEETFKREGKNFPPDYEFYLDTGSGEKKINPKTEPVYQPLFGRDTIKAKPKGSDSGAGEAGDDDEADSGTGYGRQTIVATPRGSGATRLSDSL